MGADKTGNKLAADIGGTFTDVVLEAGGVRHSCKVLTTTESPELGVLTGVEQLLADTGIPAGDIDVFVHGTTLATNALIERKGAKVGLVTTEGFRDILEMGYEKRFDHYDLMIDRPAAIVPRALRFTVRERMGADGQALAPLDEMSVRGVAAELMARDVEAVAIGLLHAYAHPRHERLVYDMLREALPANVTICLSHEVCPEIREYERFSTTCANAYVRPLMSGYLYRLRERLAQRGLTAPLYLMMSGGGLTTLETAARFPIRLVESGPAGGAILASHIARECGLEEIVSFDMGGTTAKICLLSNGEPERSRLFEVARTYRDMKGSGWPVRIPVVEMVEIGAGGGSIARVDQLGRITVGPDSAGSTPGPACYGRGGKLPAVTDANLVAGKIDPAYFAAGKIALDETAARDALTTAIGEPLNLEGIWPAVGVTEIVEENMANAARVHAIERGKAIGDCTMIAFGGGAPLHACRLAEKLGISNVLVPRGAGVGSAIGFLKAPIAYEVTRSAVLRLSAFDADSANDLLTDMAETAIAVVAPALRGITPQITRIADLRYVGQGHEIRIPLPAGTLDASHGAQLRSAFEKLYRQIYGVTLSGVDVEIVTWSLTAASPAQPIEQDEPVAASATAQPAGRRDVYDPGLGKVASVPVYWRFDLSPGAQVEGPAIIAEHETSTIVTASFTATINSLGYITLTSRERTP